jgi:glyoxylase-like metal-dependent hydrolase (beta-lactamase superfamily II)
MSYSIREVPDGEFHYPREAILPANGGRQLTDRYPAVISLPYRPILVDINGKLVLLDTGAGPLAPSTGQLQVSLRGLQVTAEMIDVVVLSHAHADHIGGLIDQEGRPAFPNARIVISRKEYEFWRSSGFRERLGDGSVYGNPAVESLVGRWFDQYLVALEGSLELVGEEAEVSCGITLVPAPGHTPGHSAFVIHDGAEPVLFTGDAFMLAEHVARPEWGSSLDLDATQTFATRQRLLDRAATDRCCVVHDHVGEAGRILRRGNGYVWEASSPPKLTRTAS